MDHPRTSLPALPVIAAAYTAGTGLVILAGWAGGVISAIRFAPQYVSAKANVAACFVLAGTSLWLQTRAEPGDVWRRVARACGATVAVVGGLTLFEYLLGIDLGIDELLFRDAPPSPGVSPGRMAPAAAGSLLAMGTALVLSSAQGKRAIETAQALCVGVVLVGLLGLLGYLYALPMAHGLTSYTMALPASAALMACSLGILALHSDRGLVAVLASDSAGGAAARRLLPWVVVAPIVIGWIALAGQLAGLYDFHLATAGMVFGSVVVFLVVVWANAYTLHRFDTGRRQSEARMKSVLDASLDAAIMMDAEGLVTSWNVRAVELFGRTRDEAMGRRLADLIIPPRYREAHTRGLSRFLATGEGPVIGRRIELSALRRDGTEFPIELTVTALQEPGGYVFNAFIADITARKEADRRLRESEEQYRLLFDSNPYPMAVFDQETLAFLAVNDAAVRHYGYSRDEFLAMTVRHFSDSEDPSIPPWAEIGPVPEGGAATEATIVTRHRKKDGSVIDVEVIASPIVFRERAAWLGLVTDVTEKRSLEAQVLQSQKIESMGRLAGGVAHDFNNLLGVILGYGAMLRKRVAADPRLTKYVDDITKAAERAAGLTRQLLAFSRKQVLQPRILNLNTVVGETQKMLRRLIGEDVHLVTVFDEGLGSVKADPGQMDQILMNLAVNARDAMPQGGRLTIETANVVLDQGYARQHPGVEPGAYVMLAVRDTGQGMSPEVQARAFEPFFTTKEPGKGTGLGLATVHGIVKQSGGHVWVYSEQGHGTTFKIYLPRTDAPTGEAESPPAPQELPRGTETILIVEDEASLRELVREYLEESGYCILEARNGAEALEVGARHAGPVHLLVTDVIMPGMSGRELAERLCATRPATRVLYMSGYTDDAVVLRGVLAQDMAFLQKPFTGDALTRAVREVLDRVDTPSGLG